MIRSAFILHSLLSSSVLAFNDWSVPCFDGECSYDSDAGSLRVWGSPAAIADITNAGGWTILDCDADALTQNIRLVCTDSAGCANLWNEIDPVGKLVRLPNSCGAQPFARIARIWDHKDQSIPEDIATLVRRQEEQPVVQGIALDSNFDQVDPAKTGEVNIAIQGSNIPGAAGDATPLPRRAVRLRQARAFEFIEDAFGRFNSFDDSVTKQLPPINVQKSANLIDQSISCPATGNIPALTASLKADIAATANAVVTVGVAAEGTIIPPKLTTFGAFAGLNADFRGSLTVKGSASGTADTGKVTFFQVGLPGLDFPGILTVGPSFKIQGQASASLEVGVDLAVDLAYTVKDAKMFFPKSGSQTSGGGFTSNESPLKLSVSPSIAAKGVVEAHLIPVVDLGITALGGVAKATVFLNLDASTDATLTLDGKATGAVDGNGNTTGSASVTGCVDIGAGISVNAGADASFFGLFDKNTQVPIFNKDFEFFKKCFTSSTAKRSIVPAIQTISKRALKCPGSDSTKLFSVANENVPAKLTRRSISRRFSRAAM